MKLKFLKYAQGADDGITLKRFKEGGTYNVPSDLGFELAKVFIDNKFAVELEEEKPKLAEIIVEEKLLPPTNLDGEIIELEEEIVDVEAVEDIMERVKKFAKNNNKKDDKKGKKK